jgi:AraC family transcriptional regulator
MPAVAAQITALHRHSITATGPSSIGVGIYAMSAGVIEAPATSRHWLSMHLGQPVWAACDWDGRRHRGLRHEGDLDLTPAGVAGSWEDESAATFLLMDLSPALVQDAAAAMGLDRNAISLAPQAAVRDVEIERIGFALKAELEAGEPNGRPYVEGLGLALAARLVSRCADGRPAGRPHATLSPRRMRLVTDYVEAHLDQDLSLHHVAAIAGLSVSHFKALFRRTAGLPLHQYIIHRRVARARALLIEGDLPISLVALEAGFAHQSHMARHMRRLLGMTPSDLVRHKS